VKIKILFFWVAMFCRLATADVLPKNGDFYISYRDIGAASGNSELRLSRTYNSMASGQGWFGYGWGGPFETRLTVMPDGSAAIQEQGSGRISIYRAKKASDIHAGVARIVAAARAQKDISPDAAATLTRSLLNDEELRVREVRRYGIQSELPTNAALTANICRDDPSPLVRVADGYKRTTCEETQEIFDLSGRLIRIENGDYQIQLRYDGDRANRITDNRGKSIELTWNNQGYLAESQSADGTKVIYSYNAKNELIKALTVNGLWYGYDYDENHNMTRIGYIDNSSMRIDYVSAQSGKVRSVDDRNGDKYRYEYRTDPVDAGHTWTKVTEMRDGAQSVHEYEYRIQHDERGTEKLASFAIDGGRDIPGKFYDAQGRVVRMEKDGHVVQYVFHPHTDKLILSLSEDRQTAYHYNDAGMLTQARDNKGQVVELEYSSTQHIVRLLEIDERLHRRRDLRFKYNAEGKPVLITMEGAGTINITYDSAGETRSITSPQGKKMALGVTRAFQDLLSVVKPAGAAF